MGLDDAQEDTEAIEAFLAERRAIRKAMPDAEASAYFGRQARVLWIFGLKRETPWEGPNWQKTAKQREEDLAEATNRVVCGLGGLEVVHCGSSTGASTWPRIEVFGERGHM